MTSGSVATRISAPSGTVTQAAMTIAPITRQRTRCRVLTSIGAATSDSSTRTTGTASCGPSNSASGGVITIAPPKPVMPRTTPAMPAIAMTAVVVATSKRAPLFRDRHLGAREADARIADVRAGGEKADELGERRRAEVTLGRRIAQRLDQLSIVERGEQNVFVARRRSELGAKARDPRLEVRCGRLGNVIGLANVRALEELVRRLRREPAVVTPRILANLVRNRLVALPLHDVQCRLRDDVLREWTDDDRVAEVLPHARHFLEDLRQPMLELHRLQLIAQIRDHAAGDLVLVERGIVGGDLGERGVVHRARESEATGACKHVLGRGQRRAVRERFACRVAEPEAASHRDL